MINTVSVIIFFNHDGYKYGPGNLNDWDVVQSLEKHHQQARLAQQAQREEEDRLQQVSTVQSSTPCWFFWALSWMLLHHLPSGAGVAG